MVVKLIAEAALQSAQCPHATPGEAIARVVRDQNSWAADELAYRYEERPQHIGVLGRTIGYELGGATTLVRIVTESPTTFSRILLGC